MTKVFKNFEADTGKILSIVINSLYSETEIFLRELLSNASDAIQKRRYLGQTNKELLNSGTDSIFVKADASKNILEIKDTGIGLSHEDLIETLGTLAKSGTEAFLKDLEKAKDNKDAAQSLIGKFGVGFYSAFMVADKVEVLTRKAGESESFLWSSDGQSGYEIEPNNEHTETGTLIRLHLKKAAKDFAEDLRLKTVIKKYSDHISVPIFFEDKEGSSEQVNSAEALWTRSPSDVGAEEYKNFYQAQFTAFDDPFITLHNRSEGTLEFTNLLYVPSRAPFDLFDPERKSKLNLYINRVFITSDLDAVLPKWLRFVQGILDTTSLDLNVSRELVQSSPVLGKIKKAITKRILSELKKKLKSDPEAYDAFWSEFGRVMKEGLYEDFENRDKVAEITRVYSRKASANITLQDYVDGFAQDQKEVYYLAADTLEQAQKSPHLEGFDAKGIDVLIMTDPIDTFWMSQMGQFKDHKFVSIVRDQYDIENIGTTDASDTPEDKADETAVIALFKAYLGDSVEDVKASSTLKQSAVRLVAGTTGLDYNMERILKAQNPDFEGSKKVVEVNLGHALIKALPTIATEETKAALCRVLVEQAKIIDGELPSDAQQFSQDVVTIAMSGISSTEN
ncbi:MAG: molecular chaperone HtpG [Paracoccaceae bacterium]